MRCLRCISCGFFCKGGILRAAFLALCFSFGSAWAIDSISLKPAGLPAAFSQSETNDDQVSEAGPASEPGDDHLELIEQKSIEPHSYLRRKTGNPVLLKIRDHVSSRYRPIKQFWVDLALYILFAVIFLILIYTVRHYIFTLNRLFGKQRHPYTDIEAADWPKVTVFVPSHNE